MNEEHKYCLISLFLLLTIQISSIQQVANYVVLNEKNEYYYFVYEKGTGWSNGTLWSLPSSNNIDSMIIHSSDLEKSAHAVWVEFTIGNDGLLNNSNLCLGHFNGKVWDLKESPSFKLNPWKIKFYVDKRGFDHLLWTDGGDLLYSIFNESSWTTPITLSHYTYDIQDFQLHDDGTFYLISNHRYGNDWNIWIGNKTTTIFSQKNTEYFWNRIIAHEKGIVDLFWRLRSSSNWSDIFHVRSYDNGLNWSKPYQIFNFSTIQAPTYSHYGSEPFIIKGDNSELFLLYSFEKIIEYGNCSKDNTYETFLCYSSYQNGSWSPQKISSVVGSEINRTMEFVLSPDRNLHRFWEGPNDILHHDILLKSGNLFERNEVIRLENAHYKDLNVIVTNSSSLQLVIEAGFLVDNSSWFFSSFELWCITGLILLLLMQKRIQFDS